MNEDQEYEDKMDSAIEAGLVCTDCGCGIDKQSGPSQCDDCQAKYEGAE